VIIKRIENRVWSIHLHATFTAALFTKVKRWKPPKCPQTDELIKCGLYVQFSIEKEGILTHVPTWVNPEGVIVKPQSQQVLRNPLR
jgi:hypothetical protein